MIVKKKSKYGKNAWNTKTKEKVNHLLDDDISGDFFWYQCLSIKCKCPLIGVQIIIWNYYMDYGNMLDNGIWNNNNNKDIIIRNLLHQCSIAISWLIVVLFMIYVKLRNRYVSCFIILIFQSKKRKSLKQYI